MYNDKSPLPAGERLMVHSPALGPYKCASGLYIDRCIIETNDIISRDNLKLDYIV